MPGILGAAHLAAGTPETIYTCPAGKVATVTVAFCNTGTEAVTVSLTHNGLPDSVYLEHEASIQPHGVLERTGIALAAENTLSASANAAGVDVSVYGFSEGV